MTNDSNEPSTPNAIIIEALGCADNGLINFTKEGNSKGIQLALMLGANINCISPDTQQTPLTIAVKSGSEAIVADLLSLGADPNAHGSLAVRAAASGSTKILALMVRVGANLNHSNDAALEAAVYGGKVENVKFLLEHGADVNAVHNDTTPLMEAADRGHAELVAMLLDAGAKIDEVDRGKKTALFWAIRTAHSDVVKILIENGADINHADNMGNTPRSVALSRLKDHSLPEFRREEVLNIVEQAAAKKTKILSGQSVQIIGNRNSNFLLEAPST